MLPIARSWKIRNRVLTFANRPLVMGIVNVTPDSFSDGGSFFLTQKAIDHAKRLEDEGADIIDIGGESTRPFSVAVAHDEELRRVTPLLEKLQGKVSIPISIDTSKASVAQAAVDLGAEIINDVSGLTADDAMPGVVSSTKTGVCVMHMQGTPATMQNTPTYRNVVADVFEYLQQRVNVLAQLGIARENICIDPGIGFGKSHEHNIELFRSMHVFHQIAVPVLVGHSRKGFIAKILGDKSRDRTFGTVGVSLAMMQQGVQILRVHDVRATRDAIDLFLATCNASTFRD